MHALCILLRYIDKTKEMITCVRENKRKKKERLKAKKVATHTTSDECIREILNEGSQLVSHLPVLVGLVVLVVAVVIVVIVVVVVVVVVVVMQ